MKALCVFSGGLDSMLAAGLIRAQGVDVLGLFFETPFFSSKKAQESAWHMDLPFKVVDITERHLEVVKRPKHGYGGNMNPCIDCHALMFRIAGEMLEQQGASFVLTGEVLGQRPMSQNRKSLALIASESGLGGLLLRPLCAKHLPPTIPEEQGWVKRDLLMGFQGRSRKPQMKLARELSISEYPAPAGGCLLTDIVFARRLKDLLSSNADPDLREIELLKLGRHFRVNAHAKVVAGRNQAENEAIRILFRDADFMLTSVSTPGPTVLLVGNNLDGSLEFARGLTAAYSDARHSDIENIRVVGGGEEKIVLTKVCDKESFRGHMI